MYIVHNTLFIVLKSDPFYQRKLRQGIGDICHEDGQCHDDHYDEEDDDVAGDDRGDGHRHRHHSLHLSLSPQLFQVTT